MMKGTRRRRLAIWLAAGIGLALAFWHLWTFGQVWRLRWNNPRTTAFMEAGLERLRARDPHARLQHRWVPYGRVSDHLKRAVLAAEDQRFLEHDGFDVGAIERAYETNTRRGRIRHGGSTISQQLAKNLFLSPHRSYFRKGREAVITLMIESVLGKRRILELYLNVIEWGDGVYGAEAAARYYFGVAAADLGPDESALLAAVIPKARVYSHLPVTPYLEERQAALLRQMESVRIP
ncbi:MAG TPA: monofunctional biosynthetic peptidoglycan transglycosylase [Candidatus Polarisedimenticolia bacterium]|nr:monofunctional biosynthetic peptidoglycan transglycosylase [Candidatus Polarisedimenticolia bacterium]